MSSSDRKTTTIGPATPAVTAAGIATERAPGATSTAMPSTTRPPRGSNQTGGYLVTVS